MGRSASFSCADAGDLDDATLLAALVATNVVVAQIVGVFLFPPIVKWDVLAPLGF